MLIRKINEHTKNDFLIKLNYETWDTIFSTDYDNKMFNSFLESYMKIFYSSFPLKRVHIAKKSKNWITLGILTSCKHKKEIFIACRNSNNLDLTSYYISYHVMSCHVMSCHVMSCHIISFIFLPQIHTGLQNPYGYGNSHIFRNQEVKATQECTTIIRSSVVLGFSRIQSIQYHKYNKIAQHKLFSIIKDNKR